MDGKWLKTFPDACVVHCPMTQPSIAYLIGIHVLADIEVVLGLIPIYIANAGLGNKTPWWS